METEREELKDAEQIVGSRLRDLRKERELTQEDVAGRLGLTQTIVAKLEAAKRPIRVNEVAALAEMFGVPLGDVFVGVEDFTLGDNELTTSLREVRRLGAEQAAAKEQLDSARLGLSAAEARVTELKTRQEILLHKFASAQATYWQLRGDDRRG